jgi:hypothetical protein
LGPGRRSSPEAEGGSLALDCEREHELAQGERVSVTLTHEGPLVVDVDTVMACAAAHGLFTEEIAPNG